MKQPTFQITDYILDKRQFQHLLRAIEVIVLWNE